MTSCITLVFACLLFSKSLFLLRNCFQKYSCERTPIIFLSSSFYCDSFLAQCCASKNYKPLLSSILSEDAPPEEEAPPPPSTSLPPLSNEGYSIRTELRKLSKCGWYWGPITRSDAEAKLCNKPDGTFLVRNSLDQNYILSLSFRSLGQSLHARIEYSNGRFSFCPR